MRVKAPGINTVRQELATGEVRTYYYHRASKMRLEGEPGSAALIASFSRAEEQLKQRNAGTLSALIKDFETTKRWRKLKDSTRSEYRRVLAFWDHEFGTVPFAGLEDKEFRRDVMKWHDMFSETKPREADNRLTILAGVLSWGAKDGPLRRNILDSFERAYTSDRAEMIWLPEHVAAFMEAADAPMRLAMVLALATGQRQADLLRLTWSAYDGKSITLVQGKGGRRVTVPCIAALRTKLDEIKRESGPILTTQTGRPFKKRYFSLLWSETCVRAEIGDLHFHDIRGTTVTALAEAGCTVPEIAAITGHSLRSAQAILDRYLARTSRIADNAIEKMETAKAQDSAKGIAKREAAGVR